MSADAEKAQITMQQERERLLADLERESERAEWLERELQEARRGFWAKLFGI